MGVGKTPPKRPGTATGECYRAAGVLGPQSTPTHNPAHGMKTNRFSRLKSAVRTCALALFAITSLSARADHRESSSERQLEKIKHIIVIYQENWSFDSLYGQFPGANGYATAFDVMPQYDVKASPAYSQ